MSESWAVVKIGDCFQVNPQRKIQRGTSAPFVPMEALPTDGRKFSNIYEREFKGSGQKFINGDTLIARITPCLENGKTSYVMGLQEGTIGFGSTEYIVLRGIEGKTNNLFAYYLARTPKFRSYAIGRMEGTSGRQRVPATAVETYEMLLPPLDEQKAIASVLGALDDKIENNRQMNQTLEEMARAIFKSWFVDFDPVHAKAAGNAPAHMDADTAALFPSSLGDDGLPVGWAYKTLGDFIEIQNGYAFKSKDWTDEGIPVVKIGSVKPSIVDLSNCSFVSAKVAEQKRNFQLRVGDILIGLTGYVGEVGRVPPADKMPMLNQRVGRVVFKRESFEPFVYAAMRLPEFKSFAESQSHGSAQANVSTKQLQEYPVIVADNLLIQKFNALLESYFEKILTNSAENQTLTKLRDTLLPKLMSGEIRVQDAEREVEAAV